MTIGGYRGDVMTRISACIVVFTVSQLESDDLNPKRLVAEADRPLDSRPSSRALFCCPAGMWKDWSQLLSFNETELYLAMSPATSDEVVAKLNAGLAKIKASGMYEAIEEKWGL